MNWVPPRPDGFDYSKPDSIEIRCPKCNRDGMNRTGLRPVGYIRTTTTGAYAIKCECNNGLIRKENS